MIQTIFNRAPLLDIVMRDLFFCDCASSISSRRTQHVIGSSYNLQLELPTRFTARPNVLHLFIDNSNACVWTHVSHKLEAGYLSETNCYGSTGSEIGSMHMQKCISKMAIDLCKFNYSGLSGHSFKLRNLITRFVLFDLKCSLAHHRNCNFSSLHKFISREHRYCFTNCSNIKYRRTKAEGSRSIYL